MSHLKDEVHHLAFIDATRGIAFLSVLACHAAEAVGNFPGRDVLQGDGCGVRLFFIVSAVTLCYSATTRVHRESYPWLYFYIRRFFRIAPVFWLALIFYRIVPGTCGEALRGDFFTWAYPLDNGASIGSSIHPWQVITSVLFINTWNPFNFDGVVPGGWSISTEMNFYLLFPLLFLCINSLRKALLACLAAYTFAPTFVHLTDIFSHHFYGATELANSQYTFFRQRWLPASLPVFITGICTYYVLRSKYVSQLHHQNRFTLLFIFACLLIALYRFLSQDYNYMSVTMILAALVVMLASPRMPGVANPLLRNLGKISFSCYITHFYMLKVAQEVLHLNMGAMDVTPPSAEMSSHNAIFFLLLFFLALLLTAMISTVLYHAVEKPGIAIGRWIIREIENRMIVRAPQHSPDTSASQKVT